MSTEKQIHEFADGDVCLWLEQESSIHLKALSGSDPVELTADEARKIAASLIESADKLDAIASAKQ
jgi:hypothetical protein